MTPRTPCDDPADATSPARTKTEAHDPREANAEMEDTEDSALPLPIEENDFNSVPQ